MINLLKDVLFYAVLSLILIFLISFLNPYIDNFLYYIYLDDGFFAGILRLLTLLSILFSLGVLFTMIIDKFKR